MTALLLETARPAFGTAARLVETAPRAFVTAATRDHVARSPCEHAGDHQPRAEHAEAENRGHPDKPVVEHDVQYGQLVGAFAPVGLAHARSLRQLDRVELAQAVRLVAPHEIPLAICDTR